MKDSEIPKGKIKDYPKGVLMVVECPNCETLQEWDVPLDDEMADNCIDCEEQFTVDITDL